MTADRRAAPAPVSIAEGGGYRFKGLMDDRLLHGVAGRAGGVSQAPFDSLNLSIKTGDDPERVATNRLRFERLLDVDGRGAVIGRLVHGRSVAVFKTGGLIPPLEPPQLNTWPAFDGDAAISDVAGLTLIMTFADCVPILLWDPDRDACGLVHSGWRGTALRIASTAVRAMGSAFGTEPLAVRAGIGPAIGPCCYSVGAEVQEEMRKAYGSSTADVMSEDRLDLWQANRLDLLSAGLLPGNIDGASLCTSCNTDRYFSHRREAGKTGRFGACIGLKS